MRAHIARTSGPPPDYALRPTATLESTVSGASRQRVRGAPVAVHARVPLDESGPGSRSERAEQRSKSRRRPGRSRSRARLLAEVEPARIVERDAPPGVELADVVGERAAPSAAASPQRRLPRRRRSARYSAAMRVEVPPRGDGGRVAEVARRANRSTWPGRPRSVDQRADLGLARARARSTRRPRPCRARATAGACAAGGAARAAPRGSRTRRAATPSAPRARRGRRSARRRPRGSPRRAAVSR